MHFAQCLVVPSRRCKCKVRARMLLGSGWRMPVLPVPGTTIDVVNPGSLIHPSGCSLVAGQSTLCPGSPDHRSRFDLRDMVGICLVYPPDLAVLLKHRIAGQVPLNSSNHMICRPKYYLPHFLILFFTALVPLFFHPGVLLNKQPAADYFPPLVSVLLYPYSNLVFLILLFR